MLNVISQHSKLLKGRAMTTPGRLFRKPPSRGVTSAKFREPRPNSSALLALQATQQTGTHLPRRKMRLQDARREPAEPAVFPVEGAHRDGRDDPGGGPAKNVSDIVGADIDARQADEEGHREERQRPAWQP